MHNGLAVICLPFMQLCHSVPNRDVALTQASIWLLSLTELMDGVITTEHNIAECSMDNNRDRASYWFAIGLHG